MPRRACIAWLLLILTGASFAEASDDPPSSEPSLLARALESKSLFVPPADQPDPHAASRVCPGCPSRSVGRSLLQVTMVNVFYEAANLIRGQVTARITPKSWWANMQQGWVWDLDDFVVNQIGHPYQGNNYYNAGRSNGLGFYESAAMAAFGSATWEYFGETNSPSLNDFINTTLGGIAFGEVLHRAAWLVRDPGVGGRARTMREIGAMAIDPVTGYNRFRTGDAKRISEKPTDMVPSSLGGFASAGVLWRGTERDPFEAAGQAFAEVDLAYGDAQHGRSRAPYDAFGMRMRLGGGGPISEARLVGRLIGQPIRHGFQLNVLQSYDYENNTAYTFGAQSFAAMLGYEHPIGSRTTLWVVGSGGLTVLGAIDSLPLGTDQKPIDDGDSSAGQGVSEGPRYYDYGPGSNFSVRSALQFDKRPFLIGYYEGRQVYSLDGVRANHFLQHARFDALWPLHRQIGIGASAEYFSRHTYYQDDARTEKLFRFPQFRVYLTWSIS